jgi:hypothetical protein
LLLASAIGVSRVGPVPVKLAFGQGQALPGSSSLLLGLATDLLVQRSESLGLAPKPAPNLREICTEFRILVWLHLKL